MAGIYFCRSYWVDGARAGVVSAGGAGLGNPGLRDRVLVCLHCLVF